MLCARLQQAAKRIDNEQWRFLLTGGVAVGGASDRQPNPAPEWLADRAWNELIRLSAIPAFNGLAASFSNSSDELKEWKVVYESHEPHLLVLPGKWKDMTTFQRLCIIRSLRPDKLVPASRSFIQGNSFLLTQVANSYPIMTSFSLLNRAPWCEVHITATIRSRGRVS